VAALREIDRLHAVQETRADRDLCNLTLTEKKDTANQTDSHASADDELPFLADGSVIWTAERYEAAKIEYQELRAPSLREQLGASCFEEPVLLGAMEVSIVDSFGFSDFHVLSLLAFSQI
jgi:hypothetical protein